MNSKIKKTVNSELVEGHYDLINKPKRLIRSFARRQGRMSDAQKQAIQASWQHFGLNIENGLLDFEKIYQRNAPRILEIGFGMGQSLLAQAQQNPAQDYLGIEVHKPGIGNLLVGVETLQLTNIRVFDADAIEVLQKCIPDNSISLVQLFFPDPWPKRRHHKRRIVQAAFVELIRQKLLFGGRFHMATDWQDYANHMLQIMSDAPGFINTAGPNQFSPRPPERPLTKFERRGQLLGHGVWDLVFEKK